MKLKNLRILNLEFLNFISYTDKISFSESLIHLPYLISFKTAFSGCAKIFKETSIYIVLGSLGKVLPKCNQISNFTIQLDNDKILNCFQSFCDTFKPIADQRTAPLTIKIISTGFSNSQGF